LLREDDPRIGLVRGATEHAQRLWREVERKERKYFLLNLRDLALMMGLTVDEYCELVEACQAGGFTYDTEGTWGIDQLVSRLECVL
jgi:hypothetical protein